MRVKLRQLKKNISTMSRNPLSPVHRDGNPRYPRLHPSSAAPSSETKGELLCRRFIFHYFRVQFVSFAAPLPSLRPGLGGPRCLSSCSPASQCTR